MSWGWDHFKGLNRSVHPWCAHVHKKVATLITTASLILAEILYERFHACVRWTLTDVNFLKIFFFLSTPNDTCVKQRLSTNLTSC